MAANWFSAPAPVARRVRAYFAPVSRVSQTPVIFDASEQGGFNLDAPPAPWVDLGWIKEFTRKATSKSNSDDDRCCRQQRWSRCARRLRHRWVFSSS